jgi:hypothetical protein
VHVPRSGGVSVHAALLAAMPTASICVKRWDTSLIGPGFTAFDGLPHAHRESLLLEEPELEALFAVRVGERPLEAADAVRVAPPESIGTVLREP